MSATDRPTPDELRAHLRGELLPPDSDRVAKWLAENPHAADGRVGSTIDHSGEGPTPAPDAPGPTADPPHGGTAPLPALPTPPERLGKYAVVRTLGAGGMGVVYEAWDESLRRSVAIKVLYSHRAAEKRSRQRFLREGRSAAAVKSDHVVTVYAVEDEGDVPYLVMELLQGSNLADWLDANRGRVTAADVVRVARDVLRGLAAAQARGLAHRDIKPSNLWVEAETGRVKIVDFGLTTRDPDDPVTLTEVGSVMGTAAYMAPEQVDGNADPRSDLFSLGVVLHEMFSGKSPFLRPTRMATFMALAVETPPPLPNCPPGLGAFIARLMEKDPAKRPPATAALAVLDAAEASGDHEPAPRKRRAVLVAAVLVVVLAAASVVIGKRFVRSDKQSPQPDVTAAEKPRPDIGTEKTPTPSVDWHRGDLIRTLELPGAFADGSRRQRPDLADWSEKMAKEIQSVLTSENEVWITIGSITPAGVGSARDDYAAAISDALRASLADVLDVGASLQLSGFYFDNQQTPDAATNKSIFIELTVSDTQNGRLLKTFKSAPIPLRPATEGSVLAVSPDDRVVVRAADGTMFAIAPNSPDFWPVRLPGIAGVPGRRSYLISTDGTVIARGPYYLRPFDQIQAWREVAPAVAIKALSGDGRYALGGGDNESPLIVWDLTGKRAVVHAQAEMPKGRSATYWHLSPSGRAAVTGLSADPTEDPPVWASLGFWAVSQGFLARTGSTIEHRVPAAAAMSPNDDIFVASPSGATHATVYALTKGNFNPGAVTKGALRPAGDPRFNPSGSHFALVGGREARVFATRGTGDVDASWTFPEPVLSAAWGQNPEPDRDNRLFVLTTLRLYEMRVRTDPNRTTR